MMAAETRSDPRHGMETALPIVAPPKHEMPGWLIAASIGVMGLILFAVLESRREATMAPAVRPQPADRADAAAPVPVLAIPPEPPAPAPVVVEPLRLPSPPKLVPAPLPSVREPPVVMQQPLPLSVPPAPPKPARSGGDTVLVIDNSVSDAPAPVSPNTQLATAGPGVYLGNARPSRASVLRNRATLVAQGTLIPAVLETAFDSTKPGLARALVSSDVRGFDGTQVLIPRGSRLTGNYTADLQAGQKRALVTWTRLVRPDGVTIDIGSPAADPAGRIGVGGKVNNHFFARFGSAILQSALDIGVNVASRAGGGNSVAIVGLPGVQSSVQPITNTQAIQPTLRVAAGTAITVFVARDLDFTGSEVRP